MGDGSRLCPRCKTTPAAGKAAYCKACSAEYMRERRAAQRVRPPGKPKRRMKLTQVAHEPPPRLQSVETDPKAVYAMMLKRHQQGLDDFDSQMRMIDVRISDAENERMIGDVKDFMEQRRKLISDRTSYELKMSAELQIWKAFAAESEDKITTINFQFNAEPPKSNIIPVPIEPDAEVSELHG